MKKESEQGKFVGVNWLTGRKIYLTPQEEKIIKDNVKKSCNILWWIIGVSVFLFVLFLILICNSAGCTW
ncbi:MAG: hypothetical protein WC511_01425 [Candidatus Pacearchaeota archaeon]